MQFVNSLPQSPPLEQPPNLHKAPIPGRANAHNPGVWLSNSAVKYLSPYSICALCIILGAAIFLNALGSLTIAYSVATITTTEIWNRNELIFISGIQNAQPVMQNIAALFFLRLADIYSRPTSSTVALCLFTLGGIIAATSPNLAAFCVGLVMIQTGMGGIRALFTLLISDYTSLRWRGFALSWTYFPFIINMWIAPHIPSSINWRWIYGMFVFMVAFVCAPALFMLFLADARQKSVSPGVAGTSIKQSLMRMDLVGLILFTAGFGLTKHGVDCWTDCGAPYERASRIMLPLGLVLLFPCLLIWEFICAPFPLMPKDVLSVRAIKLAILACFFYRLGSGIATDGFDSLAIQGTPAQPLYYLWSQSMAYAAFAPLLGFALFAIRRYKLPLLFGNVSLIIGLGLMVHYARIIRLPDSIPSTGLVYAAQVLTGVGATTIDLALTVGSQAAVSHDELATITGVMIVWPSLGDVLYSRISGEIFNHSQASGDITYLPVVAAGLGIPFLCTAFSVCMPNYMLGDYHNMVEEKYVGESDLSYERKRLTESI